MAQLKDKWWKGGGKCKSVSASASDSAAELGLENVGGVFVVLGGGCMVAFIIAIFEFLWNIKEVALEEKIPLWDAMKKETKFALNLSITTKPVHKPPSESDSLPEKKFEFLKSKSSLNTERSHKGGITRRNKNGKDKSIEKCMTALPGPSNTFSNDKY